MVFITLALPAFGWVDVNAQVIKVARIGHRTRMAWSHGFCLSRERRRCTSELP
jgi:hypothetical protein